MTIYFDINQFCSITGEYDVDLTLRNLNVKSTDSDVITPVLVELGLEAACGEVIGSVELGGDITSYPDSSLTTPTASFPIYRDVYFLVQAVSKFTIASMSVERITVKQTDVT